MAAACVKPPEVVVTLHLRALLMRFSHTKSHVYGILLRIFGYYERCKLTRAEQQIQNEPPQTQPSCFPSDSWAVMSLAALTSTVNGMQHDSLSNFRDWLKSSLRNYIYSLLALSGLRYSGCCKRCQWCLMWLNVGVFCINSLELLCHQVLWVFLWLKMSIILFKSHKTS